MAALTKDTFRVLEVGDVNGLPVKAGVNLYHNAAVGVEAATGYARPLIAGDLWAGWVAETVDNTSGSDGAVNVKTEVNRNIVLNVTGVVITSFGANVYASSDNDFTLTSTSNTLIGTVKRFVSAGKAVVST